jgi:23S rRNA (cytosine1962-C5)-methyltransferase
MISGGGAAMQNPEILIAEGWRDYALLDSGDGWKLERVGPYTFARPEPQALWRPAKPVDEWNEDARFSPAAAEDDDRGRWRFNKQVPESWPIAFDDIKLHARCTPFRHLGFFPEQSAHWRWANQYLGPGANVLNLFGYTGAASLYAARSGAKVTHVDASKKSIGQARENQALSGMTDAPIRWIADDALAFVKREARRGNKYDGIILDPPKHGRGPNGEVWQIEKDFPALLEAVKDILSPPGQRPAFVIATLYAVRLSFVALERALAQTFEGGEIESGEMTIPEKSGRLLPTAIYARWLRA